MQDAVPPSGTFGLDKSISQEEGCNHSVSKASFVDGESCTCESKAREPCLWNLQTVDLSSIVAGSERDWCCGSGADASLEWWNWNANSKPTAA